MIVRVPASSANLGPGFDALGMALGLSLECRFEKSATLSITVWGRDSDAIPRDASNLIWQTILTVAAAAGIENVPPIALHIHNDIPLGQGLGSSAAALTAAVVISSELLGLHWSRERILDEAARIEGHPDNVAACVLGGIVASAIESNGHAVAVRLPVPAGLSVAIVVPNFVLPTAHARSVLPECYSREDVVFNLQRAALLVAALATGSLHAIACALEDRLHQPFRCALVSGLTEILALRMPGLLGCALSGAGPSVLVFYETGHDSVCQGVRDIFAAHGRESETVYSAIAPHGFTLEPA